MANQLGKVYICAKCGSQVIVTKGGDRRAQVLRRPDGTKEVIAAAAASPPLGKTTPMRETVATIHGR